MKTLAFSKNFHGETLVLKNSDFILTDKLIEFCQYHSLNIIKRKYVTILTSLKIVFDVYGNEFIFGGKCFSDNGLLISSEDVLNANVNVNNLKECCGEYHLLLFKDDTLEFRADYFGYQPLFLFDSHQGQVISTSYHLLLLVLNVLNVNVKINLPHALSIISENLHLHQN
jgi:hypothetical protein